MSPTEFETPSLDQLYSPDQVELFNAIDKLRHHGACREAGLPQLIVCGDQSSGKSSVLEGLTGLRFPTKDGLCTTFATELVIRREPFMRLSSSIKPGSTRSQSEKQRLREFQPSFSSPDQISKLIDEAKDYMRAGTGRPANAFSEDVLQIEIVGPARVPLTIVDLPGLIHNQNDGQTARDVEFVHKLVTRYMQEERSIILAVVSAKSEIAAQKILKYTKDIDKNGMRTLGIITKPDTLDSGSENESSYLKMAQNESDPLRLGWHVVKNRSYQMRSSSDEERDASEKEFFSTGKWTLIPPCDLGIDSLRAKLGKVLRQHIISELPSLKTDLQLALKESRQQRQKLGDPRIGKDDYQRFLVDISQEFQSISRDASNGVYHHQFFNSSSPYARATRLRARIRRLNIEFTELMYQWGHTTLIVKDGEVASRPPPSLPELDLQIEDPEVMTRSDYMAEVTDIVELNRGRELPGTASPLAIAELFRKQSIRWQYLADWHLIRVQDTVREFLELCLHSLTDERTFDQLMGELVDPALISIKKDMDAKLQELILPYTSDLPTTYDPNFTTELQRLQAEHRGYAAQGATGLLPGKFNFQINPPHESPAQDVTNSEILDRMQAYYNVAISVFVNNIAVLAIENCSISKIPGIFDSRTVLRMDENVLEAIAGESAEVRSERSRLDERIRDLESGLQLLSRHSRHAHYMPKEHVTNEDSSPPQISPPSVARLGSYQSMSRSRSSSRSTAATLSSSQLTSDRGRASSVSSYGAFDAEDKSKTNDKALPSSSTPPRTARSKGSKLRPTRFLGSESESEE